MPVVDMWQPINNGEMPRTIIATGGNEQETIVEEYFAKIPANTPIYHFDFYRIRNVHEVYDMGYEEYISSGAVCFMEWPELIEDL